MYATSEEARSDLFLAGAVYLFGPLLLQLAAPLYDVPVLGAILLVAAPLVTTALVPVLLARHRKETAADYGLVGDRNRGLRIGALVALPVVAGAILGPALQGTTLGSTLPALATGRGDVVFFLANVASWAGLVALAVYATVKARDAFRADIRTVSEGVLEVGRYLGIGGGIAAVLLVVANPSNFLLLLLVPLGAAAAVWLLLRRFLPHATTTRAALLTPVVLLALRPFNPFALLFSPGNFVASIWSAALLGAVGLLVAALLEARRTAWPAVAIGALLALFVPVGFVSA